MLHCDSEAMVGIFQRTMYRIAVLFQSDAAAIYA
jgi:hypothetical protein